MSFFFQATGFLATSHKRTSLTYVLDDPLLVPSGGTLEMEKGGIHLVQYSTIEGLLRLGDVEVV